MVVGVHPEEGHDRTIQLLGGMTGELNSGESFVEGIERSAEEPHLLAGYDDQGALLERINGLECLRVGTEITVDDAKAMGDARTITRMLIEPPGDSPPRAPVLRVSGEERREPLEIVDVV
jgi:hypothetical protein